MKPRAENAFRRREEHFHAGFGNLLRADGPSGLPPSSRGSIISLRSTMTDVDALARAP
jgi:hypothetical protein